MRQIKGRRRQLLYRKEIAMEVYLGVAVSLCSVFLAIVLHEVAHGYAAYMLGDDTARRAGRLSLNPLNHIDPFGSVFLPLFLLWSGTGFLFGWAKPVPVSFYRLKKFPRDMLIVSGAGIATNLALALAAGLIFNLFPGIPGLLKLFLLYFVISNLVLAFFNLLPIPPLDGSKLFFGWIRRPWAQKYVSSDRYGLAVLIVAAVVLPAFGAAFGVPVIDPLRWYLSGVLSWFMEILGG